MKTLSFKVSILYIFLSIINISIFTFYIYENQMDLITENTKFLTKEVANNIYTQLNLLITEINRNQNKYNTEKKIVNEITGKLNNILQKYILFKEKGKILYQSSNDLSINDINIQDAERAIANKEFMGQFYFTKIDEIKDNEIFFYVPLSVNKIDDLILFFELDKMKYMNKRINTLYLLVIFIITLISIFHIIFGILLHLLIIRPIKILSKKSNDISKGNLSVRVQIKSKDELGQLGISFNNMAQSIQEKITELNRQNDQMVKELEMAREVQKSIYPIIRKTEKFDAAIYHRPLIKVSGDYHDILELDNNRYGFLIVDVSGHGVAAALITMLIKNLIQRAAKKYSDTKELMRFINTEFANLLKDYNNYFTAFYLIINEVNNLIFSNAAHPRAYLLRNKKYYELDTNGCVIGITKDVNSKFASKKIALKPQDKIILLTDGMVESLSAQNEQYGTNRLLKNIVKNSDYSCEKMLNNIIDDFTNFIDNSNRTDDETLIIIEFKK